MPTKGIDKMNRSNLQDFFDEAYHLQVGEYYPETHLANLKQLRNNYPELASDVIDAFYRLIIRLDSIIENNLPRLQSGEVSVTELAEELKISYYYMKLSTIKAAINRLI